ncbi:hypothetical protein HWB99_gp073 [Mycobacterium phage DrLupo]|uniref:Uncharacterized protein n=1 Tax=Mycobacterium phage DrLupo TaxID=2499037 RepID=A0A3S9UQM8_9CAUD|nr:hypothetical protein HWB99_gp073 [Mycobacterium phage DrLupo]AZS12609.1 hypothetical protein SEA_DRLUPO_73 [Mycobacterium phage DrLupo]
MSATTFRTGTSENRWVVSPRIRFSPTILRSNTPEDSDTDSKGNRVGMQDHYQQWEDKQRAMGRPYQQPIVPIPEFYCKPEDSNGDD